MHGNLKIVLKASIGNRYMIGFKKRNILAKLLHFYVLTIMKGYRMKNTKNFSSWKFISASHSTSQLNQVFILSNSWKINVPCKDFTQCKVLLLWEFEDITNVLPMLEKYSDNFLKSNFCSCSLYYIHCFQKIWEVAVKIDHNNVFSVWSSSSWTQYVVNKVMD